MKQQPLLIIFVKNPEKGKVKTRLAKDVGDDRALEIYKQLLDHTHSITTHLSMEKHVYYSQNIIDGDIWDIGNYKKFVQEGIELGDKMSAAFKRSFPEGARPVCIIGSDCLELSEQIIRDAFESLKTHDFVIGPAKDGGYYLLGMKQFHPQIFENKTYSTSSVYDEAQAEISKLGKSLHILPTLSDIDQIEDLNR